jgi:urease accessory protein
MALLAGMEGFVGGMLHPLLAPAHVISLIGLGLVVSRDVLSAQVRIIAAFASGLAGGLGAIAWGSGETPANDVLVAMAALCGLIAATGFSAPAWFTALLALVSGVAVGLDSPPEAISLREAVSMLIGTACGGIASLAAIDAAACALSRPWQGIATRVAGSWIAAIAILVLALRWATLWR